MKRLALAIALACLLSGVARAGEIHTTGAVTPTTPNTVTAAGEIHSSDAVATPVGGEIPTTGATAPSTVLTIILTLISSVR